MALDEDVRKISDDAMARLNSLQGADFDTAFANAQVRDALPLAGVDMVRAMESVEAQLRDAAEVTLIKAERQAHRRLMRVRVDINDGAVTKAAESLGGSGIGASRPSEQERVELRQR